MPIQRTREQKIKAQLRRSESNAGTGSVSYSFTTSAAGHTVPVGKELLPEVLSDYIKKDLLRTIVVSALLFATLVGIYIYLGYN
jgi:hypothetical protein